MRIGIMVFLAVLFACIGYVSAEDFTMKANMPAQKVTVEGGGTITLPPGRYPQFTASEITWNPACGSYIAAENIEQPDGTVATTGLSLAPIYLKSSYAPSLVAGQKNEFSDLSGLRVEKFPIPAEYRKSGKIIVSWTMQVLGRAPSASEQSEKLPLEVCPGAPGA